jgi:hypothetical protein
MHRSGEVRIKLHSSDKQINRNRLLVFLYCCSQGPTQPVFRKHQGNPERVFSRGGLPQAQRTTTGVRLSGMLYPEAASCLKNTCNGVWCRGFIFLTEAT